MKKTTLDRLNDSNNRIMTHLRKDYATDKRDRITTAGKFEGEHVSALWFYDLYTNGEQGEAYVYLADGTEMHFYRITDEERYLFPNVYDDIKIVAFWETEQGFIRLQNSSEDEMDKAIEEADEAREEDEAFDRHRHEYDAGRIAETEDDIDRRRTVSDAINEALFEAQGLPIPNTIIQADEPQTAFCNQHQTNAIVIAKGHYHDDKGSCAGTQYGYLDLACGHRLLVPQDAEGECDDIKI